MKEASLRVLAYFAAALLVTVASGKPALPAILVVWAIAAVVGEPIVIIRNIRYNRRIENQPTAELDAPETQPFPKS